MKNNLAITLMLVLIAFFASRTDAGIQVSISIAPPVIVDFDQPACPGDDYIWTPGYYQYGEYGYYWVPGAWVLPPTPGFLWTPGYWGLDRGKYIWHEGYWGARVGFYGGINYGNGYPGSGFTGGRWKGNVFEHNTAVTKVDHKVVHNTYEDRSVVQEVMGPHHAFNGKGGIETQASRGEMAASRGSHQGLTREQASRAQEAHESHLANHGGAPK